MNTKEFKNKSGLSKAPSHAQYKFSDPIYFAKNQFGIPGGTLSPEVQIYSLSLNVAELVDNFVIYEALKNVQEWPISKLIQRELDHERTQQICDDYLLGSGEIRYFPPLTAVLIPTDHIHLPTDSYKSPSTDETDAIKTKVLANHKSLEGAVVQPVMGGFSELLQNADDDNGLVVWNTQSLVAVIIDGQHRYTALKQAADKNKKFFDCNVTVNLIDLSTVSERTKQSPTAVARNLFITINSTPKEVDEARLVLMDDRDAISTFTQVLVDDSEENPPAVPPELVDWRCDGGKHDAVLSLTGVLTLRGIVSAAMFSYSSLSSLEDRSSLRRVRNWVRDLEAWVNPDAEIQKQLGAGEAIRSRLDHAVAATSNGGDDVNEEPFLFSYSTAAATVIRAKFKERYLPLFKLTYSDLRPYQLFRETAEKHHAFTKNHKLYLYLRAFKSKREELLSKDNELRSLVASYKADIKKLTENQILYSVMGQKAVFRTLFQHYLSYSENFDDSDELHASTTAFIESFNSALDVLQKSSSFNENLFSLRYKPTINKLPKEAEVCREFWRGIILGLNGELDYSNAAVDLLESIIIDILGCLESGEKFQFSSSSYKRIVKRHHSMISKVVDDDVDVDVVANSAVKAKENALAKLLKNG